MAAAHVTAEDRRKTRARTGDSSFVMETAVEIDHAIDLRHHGHSKTAGEVLALAGRAISRLLRAGKLTAATAERLRNKLANARKADQHRSQ